MFNFQLNVGSWMRATFKPAVVTDVPTRNYRFIEEALELVQSLGCSKEDVLTLVDYVYGRPVGEPAQEVGGATVTLAALCNATGIDLSRSAQTELDRCWQNIEKIRAKQITKPLGIESRERL